MLAVVMALCSFVIVIAYEWVTHALPWSGNVLAISVVGMSIIGGIAGFVVSALANLVFRAGPPALRVPFTIAVWAAFCAASTAWLLYNGGDRSRLLPLIGIGSFCGLLVGPYHAELFVGAWCYKRYLRSVANERTNGVVP